MQVALQHCPNRVIVTKVRGHASWADVHMGRVSMADKVGNSRADQLAVRGAEEHGHNHIVNTALERSRFAGRLQKQFLEILREHSEARKEMREAIAFYSEPEVRRRGNLAAAERQRRRRLRLQQHS